MQLHQKLLALSLVTAVLLPLVLLPVPTLAENQTCSRLGADDATALRLTLQP